MYVNVGIPGIDQEFTYSVPKDDPVLLHGAQVLVPFGRRYVIGYITGFTDKAPKSGLKSIKTVYEPVLPEQIFRLCEWISRYYKAPLGTTLQSAYPPFIRVKVTDQYIPGQAFYLLPESIQSNWKKNAYTVAELKKRCSITDTDITLFCNQGMLEKKSDGVKKEHRIMQKRLRLSCDVAAIQLLPKKAFKQRDVFARLIALQGDAPYDEFANDTTAVRQLIKTGHMEQYDVECAVEEKKHHELVEGVLSEEQDAVYTGILPFMHEGFSIHYLDGVTGSGKTHVYFRLMQDVIKKGKQVLYLVPEVSLTAHLITRFKQAFGDNVSILHSYMPAKKRLTSWMSVLNGCSVILGTRSAVFAPAKNLGLIVIDEEHETSFKQDEVPRYNGRDAALVRAKQESVPVLLGSATPAVESYAHMLSGQYHGYRLKERYGSAVLPECVTVDMRQTSVNRPETYPLSTTLLGAMRETIARGEQVILFLNRKGYNTVLTCKRCGQPATCKDCSVLLTSYKRMDVYKCHMCGRTYTPDDFSCEKCGSNILHATGMGTERLQEKAQGLFPSSAAVQIDASIIHKHEALDEIMERFEQKKIDILIGTQMIAKGLDFENVTLVGVINADGMLNIPDFRANERAYQLISQVSGRSGRGGKLGKVIIQTYSPDHYVLQTALTHDYASFYRQEDDFRKKRMYPPYSHIIRLRFEHAQQAVLVKEMDDIRLKLRRYKDHCEIIGPDEDIIVKKKTLLQYYVLLKGKRSVIQEITDELRMKTIPLLSSRVIIDVDPYSLFV